jgi:hypothetical protein
MRRFTMVLGILVAAALTLVLPAPAEAAEVRLRVDTHVRVHLVDDDSPFTDEHCVFEGSTSQQLGSADGQVALGTGQQGVDYPADRGPFRDGTGGPILFFCDQEVSACFTGDVLIRSDLSVSVGVRMTLFEGDSVLHIPPGPCDPADHVVGPAAFSVHVPAILTEACDTFHPSLELRARGSNDRATVESFCVTVTSVPPPEGPLRIVDLDCLALDGQYSCTVTHAGGVGPIRIRWFINGAPASRFDDRVTIGGPCAVGVTIPFRVVVTDGTGASASRSTSRRCL